MSSLASRWFAHGLLRVWLLLGRRQWALDCATRVVEHDPTDRQALETRAHVLAELGEKHEALQALAQVVKLAPQRASGWFNYGFMSEELGLLEQAEVAFGRAIAIDPQLDRAWYGLALCLIGQCRFDDAVAALKKNTELQPMSPFGWYQLARVHAQRNEFVEASKIIVHLRRFEPKVAAQLERETGLGAARTNVAPARAM